MKNNMQYKIEDNVNDWVKGQFSKLGLTNLSDYFTESAIPEYLKEALKGRAKTESKANFGKPDFSITKYKVPVIIENKLGVKNLIAETKDGIKFDDKSIQKNAVNGALYYATGIIASGKYREAIAIGISGDSEDTIKLQVYYVYGFGSNSFKLLANVTTLDFLENQKTFDEFYKKATLTEEEKHEILIDSHDKLQAYSKQLNKLMNNQGISVSSRILYVSGMLLSMQDIVDANGNKIQDGLRPEDLKGIQTETKRDGIQIYNQIKEFLISREIPTDKLNLMLASFSELKKDPQRDEIVLLFDEVSGLISENASCNKQIFTFIYENIYLSIDVMAGHLDIMGEMYSEFLKYALGDGKEIGIVLTPPYVTKMMTTLLNIDRNSHVMDLAAGSAGFLISAMEVMINDVENLYGKETTEAKNAITKIKEQQLLGVEKNPEMYTLAATNMILRGDGSANIQKSSTFECLDEMFEKFKASKLLLNPPFSHKENGMPFISFGLDRMAVGGLGAIIIQDSAGSGRAKKTNQYILKRHTLLASIKMPADLFQPMAGVQTSIYIFEAHKPHDYDKPVKFIDFRNDGYKRTSRSLQEIDEPAKRYSDIVKIYKAGKNAKVEANWNLNDLYIEDFIDDSGADWNFEKHLEPDVKPTLEDFKKTVSDYLAWEVSNILKGQSLNDNLGK